MKNPSSHVVVLRGFLFQNLLLGGVENFKLIFTRSKMQQKSA